VCASRLVRAYARECRTGEVADMPHHTAPRPTERGEFDPTTRRRSRFAAVAASAAMLFVAGLPAEAQMLAPDMTNQSDDEEITLDLDAGMNANLEGINDPWEPFNRRMFAVHNALDNAILVPAAKGYRAVTTKRSRRSVRRFLANARSPIIFGNDLLQGEFKRAGKTLGRFLFNTTLGLGGFLDPASRMGLEGHNEDFGQTLAVWGAPSGPYLFLPLFGPTTIRDGVGFAADRAFDPLTYYNQSPYGAIRGGRLGVNALSQRERVIEALDQIEENSLDYYASFRSFYAQSRKREIANGRTDLDELPDIGDFEDFDDLE